jgi:hypothetical protein
MAAPASREEILSTAMLLSQIQALAAGWRRSAERLERYSQPAAESFRQAADDLDRLRARHPPALDAMRALREYLSTRDP